MLINAASAVEVSEAATGVSEAATPRLPSPGQPVDRTPVVADSTPKPSKGCFILGSRSFSIPFTVDATGTQPVEVRLFASKGTDDGWKLITKKRPSDPQKQFQYEAPDDGEFWFATRTIDSQGKAHPAGSMAPQLKVFVDTTKPALQLKADADENGNVQASITIRDATPLKQVRLRYVTDTVNRWHEVDVSQLTAGGKLQFSPPSSWKLLSLQLVALDTPGNQTVITQRVRRPRLADARTNRFAVDESAVEAKSTPYRIHASEGTNAKTVSSPVIKLDRHQMRDSQSLAIAHGYVPVDASPNGSTSPLQRLPNQTGTNLSSPPSLEPAPRISTRPVHSAPPTQPSWMANVPPSGYTPAPTRPQPATNVANQRPGADIANQRSSAGQVGSPNYGGVPSYGMAPQFTQPVTPAPLQPNAMPATTMPGRTLSPTNQPVVPPSSTSPFAPPSMSSESRYPVTASPAAIRNDGMSAPANVQSTPGSIPQGLNGLFRSTPAAQNASPSGMPFAPPSERNTSTSAGAANPAPTLPPAATPMQIGEGFGLNAPQQRSTETPAMSGQPQLAPTAQANQRKEQPRPRTAAEAMRPISEKSAVQAPTQEEIPAPKAEPDPDASRYRARRATPIDPRITMQRTPVRYSESERFSLEYELEAIGNQGVEAIELYGSLDHGRTWTLWGQDPDRVSPFDIETKGEGVFGFRIVVVGANGMASPRPLAGESPDIFIVVDRTRPSVRITGAQYGEGDRIGALVIRYECQDGNLGQRPIALSFSDSPQGPWTTIAAGLRNDGDYVWRADPNLPRQLYLRIDGTDQAGNVGSYVLDQPIDTQGLAPRARIRGFQSLSGAPPTPSNEGQTAKRRSDGFK